MEEGGGGHNYYSLALRLLDYMGFATEASTEWKMGGGGHTPQRHSLGTANKCPPPYPPQISEILFGIGRGHKNVLSSVTRLQEI